MRHTRAIQYARSKQKPDAPPPEQVAEWMDELIQPATYSLMSAYQAMGLRSRILDLPVMVAMMISMIWRQIGSASELVRVMREEGLLWVESTEVSQQAVSERIRTFPAELFKRVLMDILPRMEERAEARTRPLPDAVTRAKRHFTRILIVDGSTLDVLLRKVGMLRDAPAGILGGKMAVMLNLTTRLPVAAWLDDNPTTHDLAFRDEIREALDDGDLVVLDRGYTDYTFFDELTDSGVVFVTRPKSNAAITTARELKSNVTGVRDRIIELGPADTACHHPMRLIEHIHNNKRFRYLTNEVDPRRLPALDAIDLYRRRWRVEDAFNLTKRLLGLSYLWVGSTNGVALQVWATWLVYAMLIDLTDSVAERLTLAFDALSIEMVFRAIYHYTSSVNRGDSRDVVTYLADKAKRLGLIKRVRKKPLTSTGGA